MHMRERKRERVGYTYICTRNKIVRAWKSSTLYCLGVQVYYKDWLNINIYL